MQMSEIIAPRISRLIDETRHVEQESEQIYLALGRIFPQLAAEMSKSADNADRSLAAIRQLLSEGSVARRAGDSGDFFRSLHDRDSAFLARINDSIERLGSLDEIIARVRSDSEEMEIISLNAMTVALKSGNEGKAFSVITEELKRLSGRTIALTEEVTERGRFLLESFAKLRSSLGELDGYQRDFFASLDEAITKGFQDVERDVVSAADLFDQLLIEARGVREPVLRIMQEIQLQDIVRQSLQHVGISLREAQLAAESDTDDRSGGAADAGGAAAAEADTGGTAFIAAVMDLSGNLLEDVVTKLGSSASSFGSDMEAVRSIVEACEKKRSDYLSVGGRRACLDTPQLVEGSERYLSLKREVIGTARRLADQVKGLDESFKGISALLSRFQTIVVASRIEVAKTQALQNVATTVHGMIMLTDRIATDVGEAIGTTKEFIKVASAAISEYSSEELASGERLTGALERVDADVVGLKKACESVDAQINGFALYTSGFISLVADGRVALRKLDELGKRLSGVREHLIAALAELHHEPGTTIGGEQGERLRRMVERFTIFTHKRTAGDIGNFAVEEGKGAGEVTLF